MNEVRDQGDNGTSLLEGRSEGRSAFADLVRQALQTAAAQGWTKMVWCDPDFADWPLGEREVIDALQQWSERGRTLELIAQDYAVLRQSHPRFVQWRVMWSHLIEARATGRSSAGELPSALWSPGWTMERLDAKFGIVVATVDPARRVALGERLDGWWKKGSPAFPVTTLGL
jgi:hypothetical protein